MNTVALILMIVGALNWLLVGLFQFNLVAWIFGAGSIMARIIYSIVGIAAVWGIAMLFQRNVSQVVTTVVPEVVMGDGDGRALQGTEEEGKNACEEAIACFHCGRDGWLFPAAKLRTFLPRRHDSCTLFL